MSDGIKGVLNGKSVHHFWQSINFQGISFWLGVQLTFYVVLHPLVVHTELNGLNFGFHYYCTSFYMFYDSLDITHEDPTNYSIMI